MRRGEKPPPVYAASKLGSARTLPFTRPASDSLPMLGKCENTWCGKAASASKNYLGVTGSVLVSVEAGMALRFCTWGCAGRFCAIQEIRS